MTAPGAALLAVADREEPKLAATIRRTMKAMRAQFPVSEVAALIDSGRIYTLPSLIPWGDIFVMPTYKAEPALVGDDLQAQYLQVMIEAAKAGGIEGSSFTLTNPQAIAAARARAGTLIANEKKMTQDAVKRVIVKAVRGNYTGAEAAKMIANSIGLDPRSAQAVANYTAQLSEVKAGNAGLSSLSRGGRAAGSPERYADRLLKLRSETIARTEIMSASNEGQLMGWRQAAADGLLNRQTTMRIFVVTEDDRLCEECEPLDGETTTFDGSFSEGEPPIHPACRCTTSLLT